MPKSGDAIQADLSFSQREATFKDGCLSLRKEVLDSMRARLAPGPIYNPLPRVLSKEAKVRTVKLGSGPSRFSSSSDGGATTHHPGPQSYDPNAIRTAIQRLKGSCIKGIKFGTEERECNRKHRNNSASHHPSPAEYDPEMIRRGIAFSKLGAPTHVKFQKAVYKSEFLKEVDRYGPGPQTYDPEAIRRGIIMTKSKRSLQQTKIGRPNNNSKTDVPAHRNEKLPSWQQTLPGPQHYDTELIRRGLTLLSNSNHSSSAGTKFATCPRFNNRPSTTNDTKTPIGNLSASKQIVTSTFGPQSNSRFQTQPRYTFGAR